jgi:hypothetical protein
MDDIRMTRMLLDHGYDYNDLRRLQRGGELVRLRRGAYAREDKPDQMIEEQHRRLIFGTAPQIRDAPSSVMVRRRCCTGCPSGRLRWSVCM